MRAVVQDACSDAATRPTAETYVEPAADQRYLAGLRPVIFRASLRTGS